MVIVWILLVLAAIIVPILLTLRLWGKFRQLLAVVPSLFEALVPMPEPSRPPRHCAPGAVATSTQIRDCQVARMQIRLKRREARARRSEQALHTWHSIGLTD